VDLNRRSRFIGRAVEEPAHGETYLGQTGSDWSQTGRFQRSKISGGPAPQRPRHGSKTGLRRIHTRGSPLKPGDKPGRHANLTA
jgi:hypothetical protein